ncbi:MAG TPA: hypothetical protein VHU41_05785 [Thermoanaerobaculia bacterium]|nr:hypothetical protein [Thermoanaerobaculia bacterium]
MKRALFLSAVVLMLARDAAADDVWARALLGYENYDLGTKTTGGFRQTYDLHLSKALTTTSIVQLFFRGDDFRGNLQGISTERDHTRQLQPGAEISINTMNLHARARSEYFDTTTRLGTVDSSRRIDRQSGQLAWDPAGFPVLLVTGQRNSTSDSATSLKLTDENLYGSAQYEWRGLHAGGGERYARSTDPLAGFDRRTRTNEATVGYTATALGGKLTVVTDGNAQWMKIDERSIGGKQSSVPTPVPIARALYGVDDTPTDDRDHPLVQYPLLTDGNIDATAGISISPDAVSFQNIELDLGSPNRADEIRVIVRDASGNPLRNGGGPVQWDLYTSIDGALWTLQPSSQTAFNAPLSLYSVTFDQTTARWFKVVNFGVNAEQTLVTEVQAYYHTAIGQSAARSGTQNFYNGIATVTLHPVQRFLVSYTGTYTGSRQELTTLPLQSTNDLEHIGNVQYDVREWLTLRSEYYKRNVRAFNTTGADADGLAAYVDWKPTKKLQITLENNRQRQTIGTELASIDTNAVHITSVIVRGFSLNLDFGTEDETLPDSGASARRRFATLVGNAQLLPTLRVLLTGSYQRNESDSTDIATQLLGPTRDERIYSDFIWRPGPQLTLSSRFGYLSSDALSGFTQRYHVEWRPFGDGTVALAAAFDQDIDPVTDRRARRTIINPRWLMNRYVIVDVNYTSLSTTFTNGSQRQRTFVATLTLTK